MKTRKGISLIVLVITIIVMIILAGAVILTLSSTNIIDKAEEAVNKTNTASNKYLSSVKLAERQIEKVEGPSQVTDANPGVLKQEKEIYYIESIEDLVAFSNAVNSGTTYEGKTVKLTKLLDFKSDKSYIDPTSTTFGDLNGDGRLEGIKTELTTGKGFTPIGSEDNPFKGTFDGDGTEIRNIYINLDEYHVALFGYVEDSNILNLGITGNIKSTYQDGSTAGIVSAAHGVSNNINISNCYNKAIVINEKGFVGGIASQVEGTEDYKVIIKDCSNSGSITGNCAAGLVASGADINIANCYNTADISSIDNEGGGIAAQMSNSTIINSYNTGNYNRCCRFCWYMRYRSFRDNSNKFV